MLQAHSPLWHYLWVAPNALLVVLALLILRREVNQRYPIFFAFALISAIGQFAVYIADIIPTVKPKTWWYVYWVTLLIEGALKFALIGETFSHVFGTYPSLARMGKWLISGVGVVLVVLATMTAAYTPKNSIYWIVSGLHVFEQAIYMIECGLILSLFALAAYFKLHWPRESFGIALGLGLSASVHLATWTLMADPVFSGPYHVPLVFLNMATYHACVLIWFYYLLVPQKNVIKVPQPLPEHHLEVWNQELERLLHL